MAPVRIFIVESHHTVRMGSQAMPHGDPDMKLVGTAASAAKALRPLPNLELDVLLTDFCAYPT
jgi:DNA-binding NarL/FixJ family response regulator